MAPLRSVEVFGSVWHFAHALRNGCHKPIALKSALSLSPVFALAGFSVPVTGM